ncbi:hypothetical protein [Stenotrophomonas sp. 24(2023)]|uniref:hypothetical protein n=1 Tax=Stenotrophomonas sp. 24(2023) TaxID=3068324 RepID=UPI0027E1F8FF|nr:hypothetical protein [Stenotrophomonas sp. 24(2023)]WMJ71076.1 hypothetical protein Q9R17_08290 [Stenotrophomonas sp. 24(2023)]
MKTRIDDPLKVPGLQARVEAVPGLRALYRRGSFARTLGLACFPLLLPLLVLVATLDGQMSGTPPLAHVPAGFGDSISPMQAALYSLMSGVLALVWIGFGLRNVLRNRGVRHFTFSTLIGGTVLAGIIGTSGVVTPDESPTASGEGAALSFTKLEALVQSPDFSRFTPAWQAYLQAQRSLDISEHTLTDTGLAIARGQDIGIAVPTTMQVRFETKAGLPHSARSQAWLQAHRTHLAVVGLLGSLAGGLILVMLVLGIALTVLGYHVRGRARVINGLLQQLQPPPLPPAIPVPAPA